MNQTATDKHTRGVRFNVLRNHHAPHTGIFAGGKIRAHTQPDMPVYRKE